MNNNDNISKGSNKDIGFVVIIIILMLIVLKLNGLLNLPWVVVLAPLWIPLLLTIGVVVIAIIIAVVSWISTSVKDRR